MARKNTPSHKRVASPQAFQLTKRDGQVVLDVYKHRILTSQQIEVLHFPSRTPDRRTRRSSCQRRIQGLFQHGYLDRIQRPVILGEGRQAFAYALGKRGADLVAMLLDVDRATVGWKPKNNRMGPMFLDHLINITNVRVVTHLLYKNGNITKVVWVDELALKSPKYREKMPTYNRSGRSTCIFPDGFCSIQTKNHNQPAAFFLEVDQGTMQNSLWANKVRAYCSFRDSGRSNRYFGTERFRVLAIVNSQRRLQNLKSTSEKAGGEPFVWLTTADQIDIWRPSNFLTPIWQVAGYDGIRTLF